MVNQVDISSFPIGKATASRPWHHLPPWPKGKKPRRRTELWLLGASSALTVVLYILAGLGAKSHIPDHLGVFLAVIIAISLGAHIANRWLLPDASPVLLPLVALLNGIGYAVIVRWTPNSSKSQATWAVLGVLCYVGTILLVRHSRDLERYRYLMLVAAIFLLLAPLIPHIGVNILGARLFVHVGHFQFQPVELAKLLLCLFFASYLAEQKELMAIPTVKLGNRLVVDPRPLIPLVAVWILAMAIIGVENDIGFAMLIFTMFIVLLWVATGRKTYLLIGLGAFAGGAVLVSHLFNHVSVRVNDWLHVAPTSQLGQGIFALAHGGIFGSGLGTDIFAGTIPYLTSDMIFAAIADELGLIGAAAVVMAFVLLIAEAFRIARTGRSDFSKLAATGLTTILGFQAFFIMAGVVRILPLTGITLPFVAYGGSSLVVNYMLIAVLMRISAEGKEHQSRNLEALINPQNWI